MGRPVIFINSHPIQYFAPLYKYCSENGLDLEVWYCSDESVRGAFDREFGVEVKWDIPLLEGYSNRFFKNYSPKPSIHAGFFGLINVGILLEIFRRRKGVIVVHGWNFFSSISSIVFARLAGHTVCLKGETPLKQEGSRKGIKRLARKFFLGGFLFRFVDYFLYIGTENRKFYESFGVPAGKLISSPYAVDNSRYSWEAEMLRPRRIELKADAGIPAQAFTIIYSGKYISKKRPLDVLNAYGAVKSDNKCLIMIGDGELRAEMEACIDARGLKGVILTGFINQSEISKWYALGDLFVMSSSDGETWGLSVNEAMNFGLPLVLSSKVGCLEDLLQEGINGFSYHVGKPEALAECIERCMNMPVSEFKRMGSHSNKLVRMFSYEQTLNTLRKIS